MYRFPSITTTDADVASFFRSFHNVVHLDLKIFVWKDREAPLVPFYGFSRTVRSLRLSHTSFEVFDLVCSFPLLEDLALVQIRPGGGTDVWSAPPTSPKLTGTLELSGAIRLAVRRLLDFPDGLLFAKIVASCSGEDFESMADLVSRCAGTLGYLNIDCSPTSEFPPVGSYDRSTPYRYSWT